MPACDNAAAAQPRIGVYAINTADNRLTDEILDFVKTGK
jgi:hypothetical protein